LKREKRFGQCGKMLKQKTYKTTPGTSTIYAAELAYRNIHRVMRSSDVYYHFVNEAAEIEALQLIVRYQPSQGGLFFDENLPFEVGEKVNVIYEI
jgi:hypothetical protein